MLQIEQSTCTGCGLCAIHCTEDVIRQGSEGRPVLGDFSHCLDCGHCAAVCPTGALSREGCSDQIAVQHRVIDADNMENFLSAKRSCRHFRGRPVEREQLERLINVARMAPSSKNCEEREFIVVTEKAKLATIRADLARNNRKILRLLKVLTSRPVSWFIPAESVKALRRMKTSFVHALDQEALGHDSIFYDAPAVVFIGGIAPDPFGKDNALAAQHYLMAQAQAMGLGSCIMGYAQAAPKILARHLDVPRFYKIFGVVALGHPKHRFQRVVTRKPASITWVATPDSPCSRWPMA